jgi:hypothetical protein
MWTAAADGETKSGWQRGYPEEGEPTNGGREGEGVGQTNDRSEGPIVGAVLEEIAERHRWSRELVDEERLELSFQEMNHL